MNSFVSNRSLYPFAIDKQHVFFYTLILGDASPETFESLGISYGRDNKHVYFCELAPLYCTVVDGADVDSFQELHGAFGDFFGSDGQHLYLNGEICSDITINNISTSSLSDKLYFNTGCPLQD